MIRRPFNHLLNFVFQKGADEEIGDDETIKAATWYRAGVFAPNQNRIHLVPYTVDASKTAWQSIDMLKHNARFYTSADLSMVANAYAGGVYCRMRDRIYLVPLNQSSQDVWHYIDCAKHAIVAYRHNQTGVAPMAYISGVFAHEQERIYFIPSSQQSAGSSLHYIDCLTAKVVAYSVSNAARYNYI